MRQYSTACDSQKCWRKTTWYYYIDLNVSLPPFLSHSDKPAPPLVSSFSQQALISSSLSSIQAITKF